MAMGRDRCVLGRVLVVAVCLIGAIAPSAMASSYLDALIRAARTQRLAEHPAWLSLGHYVGNLIGPGQHSLIDSPAFFNAADGKDDPAAELDATLAAFFAPTTKAQHPQCAFIARYRWLKAMLRFDPDRLPERDCPRFAAWRDAIDPHRVTLVYPAAYLNNPSSMFGHTLLRFDRAEQDERTRLLAYAVNYGAVTSDDNALLFAVWGLTGGYPGTYSIQPYYTLIGKYRDIENRDIWEYQLNFAPDEIERMLAHLWELRGQHSDYYFFDENCSYQLLFLFDVARPSLRLAAHFQLHVIPLDSVRSVIDQHGLLQRAVFHPSSRSQIEQRLATLPEAEQQLVADLADGAIRANDPAVSQRPAARRAAVLELAEAFVTYQLRTGAKPRDEAAKRSWQLLAARSRVDASADLPPPESPAWRPDQGHGSARLALGGGMRDGRWFNALRLRPVYHDQLDPVAGYLDGASIDFLDLGLRWYEADEAPILDSLTLVGIRSMTPRNHLIHPFSWRLQAGLERLRVAGTDEEGALIGALEGGLGPSYRIGDRGLWSVMAVVAVTGGEDCAASCAVGVGPALSVTWPIQDWWTLALDSRAELRLGETIDDRYELRLGQSFGMTTNLAFRLEAAIEDDGGGMQSEWLSSLHWYF